MNQIAFLLIVVGTLGSVALAFSFRNLIRSVLLFVVGWAGIAAFYLWAGAEFLAFAQLLVYVGAISMVTLFTVLLTRRRHDPDLLVEPATRTRINAALLVAAAVFAVLISTVLATKFPAPATAAPASSVRALGRDLMEEHGAALLIVGVILTVSLLGAVVLAAGSTTPETEDAP